MNLQVLCLNYLKSEGLTPEIVPNLGLVFKYQMLTFIIPENQNDNEFFQLILPNIWEITPSNRTNCLIAANKVNRSLKVAKICVFDDCIHVIIEMLVDSTPVVGDFIPRCLDILVQGRERFQYFYNQL